MRKSITVAAMSVALGGAAQLFAQSPNDVRYEDNARSTGHRPTVAEQLIFERANQEAREREGRIESRHWRGVSAQRPSAYSGPYSNSEFLYVTPWQYVPPYAYPNWVWVR
jgi:hypothetical protein